MVSLLPLNILRVDLVFALAALYKLLRVNLLFRLAARITTNADLGSTLLFAP